MIQDLPDEEWREIAGYPRYRVSNKGRVLSLVRRVPAILAASPNNFGYPHVDLKNDGQRKGMLVHRLVMLTFQPIDNPDAMEVNHIDFNKTNNCLENLEWTTKLQNVRHFMASGRPKDKSKNMGSNHHLSRLTDADVIEIRRLCANRKHGMKRAIAKQFNINIGTLDQIASGKTWRHLLQVPA